MKKRIVSAFLAVLMVCSMFGSTALAAGESARNYTVCPKCDKGAISHTTGTEQSRRNLSCGTGCYAITTRDYDRYKCNSCNYNVYSYKNAHTDEYHTH